MRNLISINLILIICIIALIICIIALLIGGCAVQPQPKLHPDLGTHLMVVPEGTKIGGQAAPEDGIFVGKSLIIEVMKEMQRQVQREAERETEETNLGKGE